MATGGSQVASAAGTDRPVLFVSDLHLAAERPEAAARFRRFLAGPAREAAALYVLGDLFEYWIGDDAASRFDQDILDALGELARSGTRVSLMHGNRDFLIGRSAAQRAGLQLLSDPTLIDLFGTPTLLTHGDALCTDDVAYQAAKARWRRPAIIAAFLALPRFVRGRIALRLRTASERAKARTSPAIMDVNAQAVARTLRLHGYPRLIHGHTHRPARHLVEVDGQRCERIVMGDWYDGGSYLRADPRGVEAVPLP